MNPDASTQAAASIEVDLSPVKEGQAITVLWRGKPVFVRNRTKEEITKALEVKIADLIDTSARNDALPEKTPATDAQPHQEGQGELAGAGRHLHASGLHPQGPVDRRRQGRLRRLVLPLPRLALRYVGPHPQGSRTAQSRGAALRVRVRQQNQDRLRVSRWPATNSTYQPTTRFEKWLDARLPVMRMMHAQFVDFPTPRNINYLWTAGALLTFCLAVQILTGIVLAMHYAPTAADAFNSVEHIRRDVNYGWLIRNIHAVGASMFFLAVYIHIGRGLYYGSYKAPREVLWIIGVVIFLLMMATAFMGYSLPWGQMSFWAVTVITNLFSSLDSVIPGLGTRIVQWLWGGFSVSGTTLTRFYSLHYLLPFVIVGAVVLHIWALHVVGQNNPTGLEIKTASDSVPMAPHAVMKDTFALAVFVLLFAWFVFYLPDYLGHADNYIEANPLSTPPHIVPEWYFLPYYAILRAIPNKLLGVIAMFSSIILLCFAPWLDTSRVRSAKYRPVYKWFFWLFIFTVVALGYLGSKPAEGTYVMWARIFTAYYFMHFLIVMPIVGVMETPTPLPRSITESVLGGKGPGPPPRRKH